MIIGKITDIDVLRSSTLDSSDVGKWALFISGALVFMSRDKSVVVSMFNSLK